MIFVQTDQQSRSGQPAHVLHLPGMLALGMNTTEVSAGLLLPSVSPSSGQALQGLGSP